MQGMISLRDALRLMTTSDGAGRFLPFDLTVVTCDLRRETGGQRVSYQGAVLAGAPFGKKNPTRNANHYLNGTRNVMVPGKARPITIHNVLITEFNGERVYI